MVYEDKWKRQVLLMSNNNPKVYGKYIKRILDVVFSALALIVLCPILLITALLVRIKLGSPVIFKQPRPGMNEKIFFLYKFRSMTNEMGKDGRLLPDAQRLTKFGKFLRASSLDELLELVNIIKGDMSIVGPRPLSIFYLPHYPQNLRKRHDVRPGLTGLAQVRGRNNLPWDERFALDIQYVDNISFVLDTKIILDTVLKVVRRADVSVRGTAKVKDYGPYSILKEEIAGGQKVAGMTYSEIGSYFWLDGEELTSDKKEIDWLPAVDDSYFTFSGRSAIDIALRDILKNHDINRVFVPSYCCVSMLQPFVDRGLKTEFYETGYKDGKITYAVPKADKHSIVLIMSYFGLSTREAHKTISQIKGKGAVIIEDITHSMLCDCCASEASDYLVASLRKWLAIPTGGWIGKRTGVLSEKPYLESNHAVVGKIKGMREKYNYLSGKIQSKEDFLLANATFDNDLIHVDRMLKIDETSMSLVAGADINAVKQQRRKNTETLRAGLMDLDRKRLSFPVTDLKTDTPLFFPIFMKTEDRDELREYLISKGIYCPVHWPEVMGAEIGIRANELSLICDQRYTEGDMQAIVNAIQEWSRQKV